MSKTLKRASIETALGRIVAVADDNALYLLQFADKPGLEEEIARVQENVRLGLYHSHIPDSQAGSPLESITRELEEYFKGTLTQFKTTVCFLGTQFQKDAWHALISIPYGETNTYVGQAAKIGSPLAHRAVANANAVNPIVIVAPCHRVIRSNGELGGYNSGIWRKKWLLQHEMKKGQ